MTRTFPLLLIGLIGADGVQAQTAFGARGGVTWANMAWLDLGGQDGIQDLRPETRSAITPSMAVFVDIPLGKHFSLVPELGYTQRGYRRDVSAFLFQQVETNRFDHLDLGVIGKLRLTTAKVRPTLLVGAVFGKTLGARATVDNPLLQNYYMPHHGLTYPPNSPVLADFHLALNGGAGLTFGVCGTWLFVEGRYSHGLTNAWDNMVHYDVNGFPIGRANTFDRSWSVHVGWMLPTPRGTTKAADQ